MGESDTPASAPRPLEVGDIGVRSLTNLKIHDSLWESELSAVEVVNPREEPRVKIEIGGEWGEVAAELPVHRAREYVDRLNEVIEVCGAADA